MRRPRQCTQVSRTCEPVFIGRTLRPFISMVLASPWHSATLTRKGLSEKSTQPNLHVASGGCRTSGCAGGVWDERTSYGSMDCGRRAALSCRRAPLRTLDGVSSVTLGAGENRGHNNAWSDLTGRRIFYCLAKVSCRPIRQFVRPPYRSFRHQVL